MTKQEAYFCHFYSNKVLNVPRVIKQERKTHSNQKEVQLPVSRWHDLIWKSNAAPDLTGGGPQAVIRALGSNSNYRRNFPGSLTAHLLLCSWITNGTGPWPRGWGPLLCRKRKPQVTSWIFYCPVSFVFLHLDHFFSFPFLFPDLDFCCCYFVDYPSIWVCLIFPCSEIQAKQFLQEYLDMTV